MGSNKKPNFFIIGAPKCGTTALSDYLSSHPNIFISKPKEPNFFNDDFVNYRSDVKHLDDYLKLFDKSTSKHRAVGEASVWYLYSSVAIRNIFRFNSNANIIVMIRNPVDLVYSLHSQAVYSLNEDERDFYKAWNLQEERKKGAFIPKTCLEPKILQYREVGKIGEQIERVYSCFPRERIKVVLFEDFVSDTLAVYKDILSFLGVSYNGRTEFKKINPSKIYYSKLLRFGIRKTYFLLRPLIRGAKKMFGVESFGIFPALRKMNTKIEPRKPLAPEFRKKLVEEFSEDIKKLSRLIHRDLSLWNQ